MNESPDNETNLTSNWIDLLFLGTLFDNAQLKSNSKPRVRSISEICDSIEIDTTIGVVFVLIVLSLLFLK